MNNEYCRIVFKDGTELSLTLEEFTDAVECLDVVHETHNDKSCGTLADKLRDAM